MSKPNDEPSRFQVLETLALLALVCLLLNLLTCQRGLLWLAITLLVIALFVKPVARGIVQLWLKFSEVVSGFNNRILLSLTFYFVLTPIALVYRLWNKDPLNLRRTQTASYYVVRDHTFDKTDLEKMW